MAATSAPPCVLLWIMLLKGTSRGSTARICLVGASNRGLTSTKKGGDGPPYGSRTSSRGSQLLKRGMEGGTEGGRGGSRGTHGMVWKERR